MQIMDTGDAIWVSFTGALTHLTSFLPALLGAVLVLVIGWLLSGFLAGLIERALKAVGMERAVEHSGIGDFIRRSGTKMTTSGVIAGLIKWFIRLIFIQAAANILGMPQVTSIINSIVLFIPSVVVAMAIIVVGSLIAKFLAGLVRGSVSEMGIGNPDLLAKLTQYVIIGFAVIAAIDQLGIAATVVNTLLIGLIGSVALAVGLAFGLGGREVAGEIARSWYEGGTRAAEALRRRTDEDAARAFRSRMESNLPAPRV